MQQSGPPMINMRRNHEYLQKQLLSFPYQTRPMISELVHWIIVFFSKNQYVDTIPYTDYLDVHFRKHPLLQK